MNSAVKSVLFNYAWPVAQMLLKARPGISLSKATASWIRVGDTVLDVGANDGRPTSIFSCAVGRKGVVHAIEPNPVLCKQIRKRIEASSLRNITVHEIAISRTAGEFDFFVDTNPDGMASSLSREHVDREIAAHGRTFAPPTKVRAVTLDQFCANIAPTFIKVDVEGFEEDVILGGVETIKRHLPLVWFECWCGDGVNTKLSHIDALRKLGYKLHIATVFNAGERWIRQQDAENPRHLLPLTDQVLQGPRIGVDVAAIPPGRNYVM